MIAEQTQRISYRGIKGWGMLALALGLTFVFLSLVVGTVATKRSSPRVCVGQSMVFEHMIVKLDSILPAAGHGYTALETSLLVKVKAERSATHKAQLRQYSVGRLQHADGAGKVPRWTGVYSLRPTSYSSVNGCMVFDLTWQPLRNWLSNGLWLAAAALLLLLFNPIVSVASASKTRLNVTFGAIVLAFMGLTYWLTRAPEPPPHNTFNGGVALISERNRLLHDGRSSFNRWIIMGDAMTRRGQHVDAVTILRGAIEQDKNDPEAWLAIGDALYSAAGGKMSQAAIFAYDRADQAAARVGLDLGLVKQATQRSRPQL